MRLTYFGALALAIALVMGCGGDDDGPVGDGDAGPMVGVDSGPVTMVDAGPTTMTDSGPVTMVDAGPTTMVDSGPTTGSGTTGEACTADGDCTGDMAMCLMSLGGFINFPGGYCSSSCMTDADCGADASCLGFGGFFSACLRTCMDDGGCRMSEGYTCGRLGGGGGGGGERYCLPPMTGGMLP